jgi:hypothetical protein
MLLDLAERFLFFLLPKWFCAFGVVMANGGNTTVCRCYCCWWMAPEVFECAMLHQQGANDSHASNAVSKGREMSRSRGGELSWTPLNLAAPRQRVGHAPNAVSEGDNQKQGEN